MNTPEDATVVIPDAPLPLDQDLPRLAKRAAALYQDLARILAGTGTDCAAAATQLQDLQPTYADVVTANAKVLHDGRAGELRAALEPHADALDAAARSIAQSATMSTCTRDAAFTSAFDRLVGPPP